MRAVLVAVVLLVTGCKGMGGLAHGLGHVASGLGHAASGLGHVASGVGRVASLTGRVLAPAARAAVRVAPYVVDGIVASQNPVVVVVGDEEPVEHVPVANGPLIDDGDACGYCPEDVACGECGDVNHVACVLTPANSYARCESQLKQHPPGE